MSEPVLTQSFSEGFIRQRRNLMIVSLILLVYDFSDAQIAKVSVLGTELIVGKPWVLVLTIWSVWAYFLLRYWQYFITEDTNSVRTSFINSRRNLANAACKSLYKIKHPDEDGIPRFEINHKGHFILSLIWEVKTYINSPPNSKYEKKSDEWQLSKQEAASISARALWETVLKTTSFTDRIVPFFLAAGALITSLAPIFWDISVNLFAQWCL